MRIALDELRRGLGAPAFELWLRLLAAADRGGLVRMTRADMMNHGAGVSEPAVKRALERLRRAGLVTAAASRKNPTRTVRGRQLSRERADVPAGTWRFVRSSPGRGGRRRGAGRPSSQGEKSNRTEKKIQTGPRGSRRMREDEGSGNGKGDVSRSALKTDEKSNRAETRNQTGPIPHTGSLTESRDIFTPSLRSVVRCARGHASAGPSSSVEGNELEELLAEHSEPDVLSLEEAVRRLGLEDVPPRPLRDLLRLEGVPGLLLADGRRAELGVRSPTAPPAVASRPADEVLSYLARLWRDLTELVFGEVDLRMNGVAAAKKPSRLRPGVLAWYRACDEKKVAPAEWLLWELEGWRDRHPKKRAQIPGVMSEKRVRDGKVRRIFRISSRRLGGRVTFDEVGRAYLAKTQLLERKLDRLVAEKIGRVTDDEVFAAVREIFPKGAANAARILEDVHARTTAETTRLADLAALGSFVWANEQ